MDAAAATASSKASPRLKLKNVVLGLKQSATLYANEEAARLASEGRKVYRLGFGQSPFPPPAACIKALAQFSHEKDYLPVQGLATLREQIARFAKGVMGLPHITADRVMIGPGTKEMLYLSQVVWDGTVLLPTPSWVSYEPQAKINGNSYLRIPTTAASRWCVTAADLEKAAASLPADTPKMIILTYPNNPTGTSFTREEAKAIGEVCRRHGIVVVADEIYGLVHHDPDTAHVSIADYYPEGTIVSTGMSKWAGAGGWRLGAWLFPEPLAPLLKSMKVVASELFSSVSAPTQYAAIDAFDPDSAALRRYVASERAVLQLAGSYCHRQLADMGVEVQPSVGGFYLYPDFSAFDELLRSKGIQNVNDLCLSLLRDAGVSVLPSTEFGQTPQHYCTRMAYVDFPGAAAMEAAAAEGLPRLLYGSDEATAYESFNSKGTAPAAADRASLENDFVEKYCPNLVGGMEALRRFLA